MRREDGHASPSMNSNFWETGSQNGSWQSLREPLWLTARPALPRFAADSCLAYKPPTSPPSVHTSGKVYPECQTCISCCSLNPLLLHPYNLEVKNWFFSHCNSLLHCENITVFLFLSVVSAKHLQSFLSLL